VVLNEGEIAEIGSHEKLIAANGLYAKLQKSLISAEPDAYKTRRNIR